MNKLMQNKMIKGGQGETAHNTFNINIPQYWQGRKRPVRLWPARRKIGRKFLDMFDII